ncbi:hypothetical protein [Archaeoglobus sp.]
MGVREIWVRVGERKEPVEVDGRMTAEDLIRKMGGDPGKDVVVVNGVTLAPQDRVAEFLTEGENHVKILPKTVVGSSTSNFFNRLKLEETLLREIGFYRVRDGIYRGRVKAGNRIIDMDVLIPRGFPHIRPVIMIYDPWFLGRHPCIIRRNTGIEVHFVDDCWHPEMHAADLAVQAVDFLDRVAKESGGRGYPWRDPVLELARLIRSLRGL